MGVVRLVNVPKTAEGTVAPSRARVTGLRPSAAVTKVASVMGRAALDCYTIRSLLFAVVCNQSYETASG